MCREAIWVYDKCDISTPSLLGEGRDEVIERSDLSYTRLFSSNYCLHKSLIFTLHYIIRPHGYC